MYSSEIRKDAHIVNNIENKCIDSSYQHYWNCVSYYYISNQKLIILLYSLNRRRSKSKGTVIHYIIIGNWKNAFIFDYISVIYIGKYILYCLHCNLMIYLCNYLKLFLSRLSLYMMSLLFNKYIIINMKWSITKAPLKPVVVVVFV